LTRAGTQIGFGSAFRSSASLGNPFLLRLRAHAQRPAKQHHADKSQSLTGRVTAAISAANPRSGFPGNEQRPTNPDTPVHAADIRRMQAAHRKCGPNLLHQVVAR
jgi:hypothetical protein